MSGRTDDETGTGMPRNGPTSYEIGFLLRGAHQRAAAAFSTALAPLGIEGRHFAVLNQLDRQPHSQRQLVDLIGSDKASMVRLVDDLEAKGLVRRDPAPGDRRVRAVTLTEHGTTVLSQARETARDVAAGLLTHMKPDDREDLTRLLGEFLRPQRLGS
jgi:MarR family transcriptional regulator, lower aerobic nicotinate degradation pathway regulator